MLRSLKVIAVLFFVLLAYLLFWPVPIEPKAWVAPELASYSGDFKPNNKLAEFTRIDLGDLHGAEAAVQAPTDENGQPGQMVSTTDEGWIMRWQDGSETPEKWVNLGGRPLGLAFDAQGDLWVANAYVGLMKITKQGVVSTELTTVDNAPLHFIDDLDFAPNGNLYFSDASTFSAKEWGGTLEASLLDLMEHGLHGRIVEYNPKTKASRVIMRDLSFANGVAVDSSGEYLLVAETGEYRVWKYWLQGPNAGSQEVIIDNLPGFPDNVHRGQNGRFWVGLTSPRSDAFDQLAQKPFVRKIVQRLPEFMHPKVQNYGVVFAMDGEGNVLKNLQDPEGNIYATTGAFETQSYLYVTSLTAPFLARYSKAELGIK